MGDFQPIADAALFRVGQSTITVGGIVTAVLVATAFMVAARVANVVLCRIRDRPGGGRASLYLVQKLVTYGLVIAGIYAGLTTLGLNLTSLAVFAGALGVGVGLGLQGIVKEFVSGLVIIFDRQIQVGDFVELEDVSGLIQEVGPRATRLRTNDNLAVLVPNSKLIENRVINWTLRGQTRRIHVPFTVAYGADKDRVRDAVLEAARGVPFTLPDTDTRKTQVWMTGFGESALNFELVVWPSLEAVKRPSAMQAAYTWAIDDALRKAQIEIPYAQTDLRIRSLFGHEGDEALDALGLKRVEVKPEPTPEAVPPSRNDAAEDLVVSAEAEKAEAHGQQPIEHQGRPAE